MAFVGPTTQAKLVCDEVNGDYLSVTRKNNYHIELDMFTNVGLSITVSLQDLKDLVTYLEGLE